ncbi:MAG: nitroreductase family protein [Desulfovibrionaceae bacterium]|nr:nitroreductase family protein [Desulfovibrionaceae bacterium]
MRNPALEIAIDSAAVDRCNGCGHCAAVCPAAAISLDAGDPLKLPPRVIAPLEERQREGLFKARRSTRTYTEQKVSHELILRALEHARYAPTAGNSQQVEWILVEGKERLHGITAKVAAWAKMQQGKYARVASLFEQGRDPVMRGAPALLLAHAGKDSPWKNHDAGAALSYLELALHSYGLGTCWAGFVISAARSGTDLGISLPEKRELCAGLLFGYPVHTFQRLPPRKPVRIEYA